MTLICQCARVALPMSHECPANSAGICPCKETNPPKKEGFRASMASLPSHFDDALSSLPDAPVVCIEPQEKTPNPARDQPTEVGGCRHFQAPC